MEKIQHFGDCKYTLETMNLVGITQRRWEDTLAVGTDEADWKGTEHVAWLGSSNDFATVCQYGIDGHSPSVLVVARLFRAVVDAMNRQTVVTFAEATPIVGDKRDLGK